MSTAPPPLPYLDVIDSFGIRRTRQFFLIGRLHGAAEPGMFANIKLGNLFLCIPIKAIEEVEFSPERQTYTLLELHEDEPDFLNLMLFLDVGLEFVPISEKNTN